MGAIFALPATLAEWGRLALLALVVGPLCFILGQCEGKQAERARQDAARAEANVQALQKDRVATEAAAAERVADATEVSANEERLIDAIADTPDTAPDAHRVKLGCARLLAQGTSEADLPAVCRPAG